jgi:hypothetical protein
MELTADIIGTNPSYPPIADHSWLNVDISTYDNYPSDNNPVRVIPKLNAIWDHNANQSGINLIPNSTVMPLGVNSSVEDQKVVTQVIKEAKKAAMAGLKGKALTDHLRARFAKAHIASAAEGLKKVSEELGLLGNVYIDASAFNSYQEAENFLKQHRTRLAQDILLNSDSMSSSVVSVLASNFHKNAVDKIEYNESLFNKYKSHLVSNGRIASDFVIDSKESLRQAFLAEKIVVQPEVVAKKKEKVLTEDEMAAGFNQMAEQKSIESAEIQDSIQMSTISPVISYIQENISKGKTASDVKEMLRSRFLMNDIKTASEAISIVLSKDGLTETNIDGLVKAGKITLTLGNELKRVAKKYPVKKATVIDVPKSAPMTGATGFMYAPKAAKIDNKFVIASVEALRKGIDVNSVRGKLLSKMSSDEACSVLGEAINQLNSTPAGSVANKVAKPKKELIEEPVKKDVVPDEKEIMAQTQDILSYFDGGEMGVEIDAPFSREAMDIEGLMNTEGISEIL